MAVGPVKRILKAAKGKHTKLNRGATGASLAPVVQASSAASASTSGKCTLELEVDEAPDDKDMSDDESSDDEGPPPNFPTAADILPLLPEGTFNLADHYYSRYHDHLEDRFVDLLQSEFVNDKSIKMWRQRTAEEEAEKKLRESGPSKGVERKERTKTMPKGCFKQTTITFDQNQPTSTPLVDPAPVPDTPNQEDPAGTASSEPHFGNTGYPSDDGIFFVLFCVLWSGELDAKHCTYTESALWACRWL